MVQGIFSHFTRKIEVYNNKSSLQNRLMLHCLKKMRLEINGHCVKIRKRIQTTKELLGVCDTASWY